MERINNTNPKEIISNTLRRLESNFIVEPNMPIATVKELSRSSGLDEQIVFKILQKGLVFTSNIGCEVKASLVPGKENSKRIDKVKANLENMSQRFERRFQFQDRNAKGRPISKKIEARTRKIRRNEMKIVLTSFNSDDEKSTKREQIKDKLALRWMFKDNSKENQTFQISERILERAEILKKIGLWDQIQDRSIFSFRLSEDILNINDNQKQELELISKLIFMPGGYLDGSISMFNDLDSLPANVQSIFAQGIDFRELSLLRKINLEIPTIARLDLVLSNDGDTSFKIVEIEGDKTHAFGYVTIIDDFREKFNNRNDTKGIVESLKQEMICRNINLQEPIILIVGNGSGESFYLRELKAFAEIAKRRDLNIITLSEDQVEVNNFGVFVDNKSKRTKTIINIPKLFNSEGQFSTLANKLLVMASENKLRILIPPARFLGGKGLLGLVSNGLKDEAVEKLLVKYFDPVFLEEIRKFIPKTANIRPSDVDFLMNSNLDEVVIKKVMASGMKGVALPINRERQIEFLNEARIGKEAFVIQQAIQQKTLPFSFVEPNNMKLVKCANMFMRISLFASRSGIATVGVTARETPDVHGSRDAIQIPIIFGGQNDK